MRAVVCGLLLLPFSAYASTLYYGGDWDGIAAPIQNEYGGGGINHFDDFDLSSRSIVTGFFINTFLQSTPASNYISYTLRRNVQEGNGGELIAYEEGYALATIQATGRSYTSIFGQTYLEYKTTISDLSFNLSPGKYWLQINLVHSDLSSPARMPNSIGSPGQNGLCYAYSVFAWLNYVPRNNDISFGVEGYAVPEPTSLAALGLFALLAVRKRKPVN